ncbi:MAG TPA: class I SAM-dependent methyltransferase [Anaerolineaceae bacterium]|nr:class I SAM-dependent methyltransferase [Anaerolineaceae bacterium]
MSSKETIMLSQEQETLLIPLYAKATESHRARPIFSDPKAGEILAAVAYDFSSLRVPRKTSITLCLRATRLDAVARNFLNQNPTGRVLHLGCGLDSRCLRIPPAEADWYDLDLPMVIDLRRKFYPEKPNYHLVASSVTAWDWIEQIPPDGRPTLVIAEGLLMYLTEADVRTLILKLQQRFPGCHVVADVYSQLTVRQISRHPSLKKTGATIRWGIDEAKAIERWGTGIRLIEEWYFAQAEEINRLSKIHAALFKLAGRFAAANLAHRIIQLELS